jgi:hypothetical protein
MSVPSQNVRVLIFPIYRNYWLYHAWREEAHGAAAAVQPALEWSKGRNLEERVSAFTSSLSKKARRRPLLSVSLCAEHRQCSSVEAWRVLPGYLFWWPAGHLRCEC